MSKSSSSSQSWYTKIPLIGKFFDSAPVVPVVRMAGVIGASGGLRRPGLSLAELAEPIDTAFKTKGAKAVALIINSPGGSPVQSALIAQRVRLLAAEAEVPVIAFCEDAAASGGYWLACAADEIIAADASVIGSIGVISAGFGFQEAIEKLGVERRVYAAGDSKSQLDPFLPENPEDIKRLRVLQDDIHDQFKEWVLERRGEKLDKKDHKKLFSGQFWTGRKALELGLIDDIGEIRTVLRKRFGENVLTPVANKQKGWIAKKLGLDSRADISAALAQGAFDAVEERAAWNRVGLS